MIRETILFPSPHSGILFLSEMGNVPSSVTVVSVPSFGDSFFIEKELADYSAGLRMFPSPHSGILFLFEIKW